MTATTTISLSEFERRVRQIFETHGLTSEAAGAVAAAIAAAERDECKSHGLHRVGQCLEVIEAGKVEPDARPVLHESSGPIVRVDAGGGFYLPAWETGRPAFIERARELGLAALVVNDGLHFSALWYEVEHLARAGLASLSICPSYATVAPFGGRSPLIGTNPFAFGWPRPDADPFVFDFATSVVARGEIELKRQAGQTLPEGWAVGPDGEATTDPQAALDGALLPFGAHKGSAIAVMIELMAGAMIGDRMSREARDFMDGRTLLPRHGALILAFEPGTMAGDTGRNPFADGEGLIEAIAGQTGRLPSQRRYEARARTERDGLAFTDAEMTTLERLENGSASGRT